MEYTEGQREAVWRNKLAETQIEGGSETMELFAGGKSVHDLMAVREAERAVVKAAMEWYQKEQRDDEDPEDFDAIRAACRRLREVRGE